jgi:hypothetical protein
MSVPQASPRRATLDAIALAIAFLAVDGFVVAGVLAGWVERSLGVVTVLALAAVVLLLYRDDVAEAIAAGNEKLARAVDDEAVRQTLDALAEEGWTVEHEVAGVRGSVAQGPSGAYLVTVRNRAYRLEHLGRARHDAARLHGQLGGWVTPVVCLVLRDDDPHRRDGVWIMGADHLAAWLRQRTPPRGKASAA